MSLLESILFFLPLFLVVNLVAAVPGRDELKNAMRVGFRHFVTGTLILFVGCAAFYWLMEWLISIPPLW